MGSPQDSDAWALLALKDANNHRDRDVAGMSPGNQTSVSSSPASGTSLKVWISRNIMFSFVHIYHCKSWVDLHMSSLLFPISRVRRLKIGSPVFWHTVFWHIAFWHTAIWHSPLLAYYHLAYPLLAYCLFGIIPFWHTAYWHTVFWHTVNWHKLV